MNHARAMTGVFLLLLGHVVGAIVQQSASGAAAPVPSLVNYSGVLNDSNGKALSGTCGCNLRALSKLGVITH